MTTCFFRNGNNYEFSQVLVTRCAHNWINHCVIDILLHQSLSSCCPSQIICIESVVPQYHDYQLHIGSRRFKVCLTVKIIIKLCPDLNYISRGWSASKGTVLRLNRNKGSCFNTYFPWA